MPIEREPSGRVQRNAPRRKAKTMPPPPPGSPERKALEGRPAEPAEGSDAADAPVPAPPKLPPPVPGARPRTSAGKSRAARQTDVPELNPIPEADKTKENRGAVGIKHDRNASLTANAASGTIGDTPVPLLERAAGSDAGAAVGGSAPVVARGTPTPASIADKLPLRAEPQSAPALPLPPAPPAGGQPAPAGVDSNPRLTVPVGEFEEVQTILDQDKLRIAHAQATIVRDTANALLGVAEPAPAVRAPVAVKPGARGALNDASASSTGRFERGDPARGDPTDGEARDDATTISPPPAGRAPAGTLRSPAALPRRRGITGDLRYIATVVFGLRAARRELAELSAQVATRQKARRHHLVTLGRAAVVSEGFYHPALAASRERLAAVEDERSQHAGHVVAADAELTRVRRDREAKAKQYIVELAALDAELASCTRKLEPLDKDIIGIKRRAADLHESLRRIDARIAATEARLASGATGKLDPAEVQAEIATLRADRKAIQRDEPVIAGEIDAVAPRIAALEAQRSEAQRRRSEMVQGEQDDQRRVEELLAAIGAKRKVVDRAAADAEVLRDKILFELGERLYVDRPEDLAAELSPIDEIDVELGDADRRTMELREILSSVVKLKLARGIALLVVVIAAIGALTGWLLYLFVL